MNAVPGWYPDPSRAAALRWWDGVEWTSSTQSVPPAAAIPDGAAGKQPATDARAIALGALALLGVALLRFAASADVFGLRIAAAFIAAYVLLTLAIAVVVVPRRRRQARRAVAASSLEVGASWIGAAIAQPPNLALGQSSAPILAPFRRRYWTDRTHGVLAVNAGRVTFEPKRTDRNAIVFGPGDVLTIGATRWFWHGWAGVVYRDNTRQRFVFDGPPRDFNAVLAGQGFRIG